MQNKKDYWKILFVTRLLEEIGGSLWDALALADELHAAEKTLHRLAENDCNGYPVEKTEKKDGKTFRYCVEDPEWRARDEKTFERIHKKIDKLLEPYPTVKVNFYGDPRGAVLTVNLKKIGAYDQVLNW